MVVLIDTNIVIDYLLMREPFGEAAEIVLKKCATKEWKGYLAFHSIPNLWYILRKAPEKERRRWLRDICTILEVVGASHDEVVKAIQMEDFKDFEDCLQDRCAVAVGADYIITRNTEDYLVSSVKAITPEELLQSVNK